jgi:hypothetical protein
VILFIELFEKGKRTETGKIQWQPGAEDGEGERRNFLR